MFIPAQRQLVSVLACLYMQTIQRQRDEVVPALSLPALASSFRLPLAYKILVSRFRCAFAQTIAATAARCAVFNGLAWAARGVTGGGGEGVQG